MNSDPMTYIAHYRESDGRGQNVYEHLDGTGVLAEKHACKIGMPSFGRLMGSLHDLGKLSGAFQSYLRSAVGVIDVGDDDYVDAERLKGKIDHASAGAQYIWQMFKEAPPLLRLAGQIMSLCIASHHTGLIDCLSPGGDNKFNGRMVKSIRKTHLDESKILAKEYLNSHISKLSASPQIEQELRRRLELLFDGERSHLIREFRLGLLVRFLFSSLIDADRLDTAEFERGALGFARSKGGYPAWDILIERLEARIGQFQSRNKVDEIRAEISSACLVFAAREKGIYQLTVPAGGGKTLASLRFALHHANHHRMDRILYVVPYTTIIDQNAAETRRILESPGWEPSSDGGRIVLEHHSNLAPELDTSLNRLLSETWDAPIVFTTSVQFLETLFAAGTNPARRMHQLANAVIIFDEIQTTPIRTVHLFNNAVNFLARQCGSTVVLCTATQPLLDKVDTIKGAVCLSAEPGMIADPTGLFNNLRRVEVVDSRKDGGWSEEGIMDAARRELERAGSVLIIVNTKKQARNMYLRCRGITKKVFHLSTAMCPAHRMDILDRIREHLDPAHPSPVICVSTQLIEAGVDIDFGSVIRYMTGLDSIAQAAGRCNRHGLRDTGRVLVVNPANENLDRLPDIRIAREKTAHVLDDFHRNPASFDHDLLSPAAMNRYYHYYFYERAHEMAYPLTPGAIGQHDNLLSLLSTNELAVEAYVHRNGNTAPPLVLRQSFATAGRAFRVIDAPTEGIVVPYGEEGTRIIADLCAAGEYAGKRGVLKAAQRYSVNLFPYEIERLVGADGLFEAWKGSGVRYLDSRHYNEEFGISIESEGPMPLLIR